MYVQKFYIAGYECCIMSRCRYRSVTVKRKLEIIDKVDSPPTGKQIKDLESPRALSVYYM